VYVKQKCRFNGTTEYNYTCTYVSAESTINKTI